MLWDAWLLGAPSHFMVDPFGMNCWMLLGLYGFVACI